MDRDGILKQLGEQKCAIYCQYEEKAEEMTGEIRHCKKKGRWFVAAQLSTFLLAVISIAIYATYYAEMIIVASGIFCVLAYIAARRLDDANSEKLERLRRLISMVISRHFVMERNMSIHIMSSLSIWMFLESSRSSSASTVLSHRVVATYLPGSFV